MMMFKKVCIIHSISHSVRMNGWKEERMMQFADSFQFTFKLCIFHVGENWKPKKKNISWGVDFNKVEKTTHSFLQFVWSVEFWMWNLLWKSKDKQNVTSDSASKDLCSLACWTNISPAFDGTRFPIFFFLLWPLRMFACKYCENIHWMKWPFSYPIRLSRQKPKRNVTFN